MKSWNKEKGHNLTDEKKENTQTDYDWVKKTKKKSYLSG